MNYRQSMAMGTSGCEGGGLSTNILTVVVVVVVKVMYAFIYVSLPRRAVRAARECNASGSEPLRRKKISGERRRM